MGKAKVTVVVDKASGLKKALTNAKRVRLLVGIPSSESPRGEGESNAVLGILHEYGSPARRIPPRPFLTPAMDECKDGLAKILSSVLDKNVRNLLEKAGLYAQAQVKGYIVRGENFAPLSKMTLAARREKGFTGTKPLIETGQLLNSISYAIREM